MIRQKVEVSNAWPTFLLQEQDAKDRAQILHDDQTKYKMRNGLPETYPLFYSLWISLNRQWQDFWFEQMRIIQPGWTLAQLKKAYGGLVKDKVCFTDLHAPQNGYADYINGVNVNAGGLGHRTITTGGNLQHILGGPYSKGGIRHWQVECMDTTKPPPDPQKVNRFTRPDLIQAATTRTKITLPNGLRKVDPFPQLGGLDVPSLMISNVYVNKVFQHNFIRESWIKFIPSGSTPTPYVR